MRQTFVHGSLLYRSLVVSGKDGEWSRCAPASSTPKAQQDSASDDNDPYLVASLLPGQCPGPPGREEAYGRASQRCVGGVVVIAI